MTQKAEEMSMDDAGAEQPASASLPGGSLYELAGIDPYGELVDASELSADDIAQIDAIMAAMGRLREVEQQLSAHSHQSLELNETDLRAVQFLIVAANRGAVVTAGDLARHLGITTASTTKMLHRMERAGHIRREPHPGDRRSVAITLSPASRRRAIETVGRQQAGRVAPAAALTPDEREAVRRFLTDTADALQRRLG